MDFSDPAILKILSEAARFNDSNKPRVLLAACGCIGAVKFGLLCHCFIEWAEIRAVVTQSSLRFIDRASLPKNVFVYYDDYDWYCWRRMDIELLQWADIMVIAPLSANTLAKIAGGYCDDLLTSTVRGWDAMKKPLLVAPSMHPLIWANSLIEMHCIKCTEKLGITLIPPRSQRSGKGKYSTGAMTEPYDISLITKITYQTFRK